MRFVEPEGGVVFCIVFCFFGGDYVKKDSKVMNTKLGMKVNSFNLENIVTFFYEIGKYHKHNPSQCGRLESVWVQGLAPNSFAMIASECITMYVC